MTSNAEEGLKHATSYVHLNLKLVGAWPIPVTSPLSSKITRVVLILVTTFLFHVSMIPGFLYVFLKAKNSKTRLRMVSPLLNMLAQYFKYNILLLRADKIRKCLNVIEEDWLNANEKDRSIFRSKAKIVRKVILTVVFTMYGGGLCFRTIVPLTKGKIVTPDNVTIRPLACPGYFVYFDEQRSPVYEIIFALQFFSGIATYAIMSGSYGIFALFGMHLCALLRILSNKIKELNTETDLSEKVVQERITDIVEHETKIKGFLKNVEAITEILYLIELADNTCIICLLGHRLVTEMKYSNATTIITLVILQSSFIFCAFILCYIGQLLVDERRAVGISSVTIDWYRLPIKKARCLILIITMSNYPIQFTAGKIVEISLITFINIMKLSMGYLNILREVV